MSSIYSTIFIIISFIFLNSCNATTKEESFKKINLIDFLEPDVCEFNKNCYLKYFQTELIENYKFSAESILTIKEDSILVDFKMINPRNLLFNQKFIIKKEKYYTYYHSAVSPGVKNINFDILKGDYLRINEFPVREMETNIMDQSPINLKIRSTYSRLFDTIYNNMPKRALEIKGVFKSNSFQNKSKSNFSETIIEGVGTIQFVIKEQKDTISNTILDSIVLVNREDLLTFPMIESTELKKSQ